MSAYFTDWCPRHGDWDHDVDRGDEECPDCTQNGCAPSQLRAIEIADLRAEVARLTARCAMLLDSHTGCGCPPTGCKVCAEKGYT